MKFLLTILFLAWIGGVFVSLPALWRKIIGDPYLKNRFKRRLPVNKKSIG